MPHDSGACPPCGPGIVSPPGCSACPDNSGALARIEGKRVELTTRLAAKLQGDTSYRLLLADGRFDCEDWQQAYPDVPSEAKHWVLLAAPRKFGPDGETTHQLLQVLDSSVHSLSSNSAGIKVLEAKRTVVVQDASVKIRGGLELQGGFEAVSCQELPSVVEPNAQAKLQWRNRVVALRGALWKPDLRQLVLSSTPVPCAGPNRPNAQDADWIVRVSFGPDGAARSMKLLGLRVGPFTGAVAGDEPTVPADLLKGTDKRLEHAPAGGGAVNWLPSKSPPDAKVEFNWSAALEAQAGSLRIHGSARPRVCRAYQ